MDTVQALQKVIMFKDIPEPVLQLVARTVEEVSVAAGETIVSAHDTPNALYVIRHGTVRVFAEGEGGKEASAIFGTGETFGDAPFVDGGTARATAIALERVDLLVIRSANLADALADRPEAGYELYRAIARSLAGHLRRAVSMLSFSGSSRGQR